MSAVPLVTASLKGPQLPPATESAILLSKLPFILKKYIFVYLTALGLSFSIWDLDPSPRIEPRPPALGAWSLGHWTTREASKFPILLKKYSTLNVYAIIHQGSPIHTIRHISLKHKEPSPSQEHKTFWTQGDTFMLSEAFLLPSQPVISKSSQYSLFFIKILFLNHL